MEKLYTSKTSLKMAGRGCLPLILPPLDPSLAISYRNHQKSMAYFSYLAQLILFLFTKRQSQKGGGGKVQCPPKYASSTGSVANVKEDVAQVSFSIIWLLISILRLTKTFSGA